jgi:hypothetical protein
MPKRLRTFIGAIVLGLFIPFYAMIAMVIASAKLPDAPVFVQTVVYAVLGLLWVLPAGAIVAWLARHVRRSR